jgi:hypothetical protein
MGEGEAVTTRRGGPIGPPRLLTYNMHHRLSILVSMNRLSITRRCQVIASPVEGKSIRSTVRMTGVAKNTVIKLLVDAGAACARFQNEAMRNLPCRRLQCDEIWSFCQVKDRNIPERRQGEQGIGSVWTWVAIDAETKLVPTWLVGLRDAEHAEFFISDLTWRLSSRVQLTTDGLSVYLEAVEAGFGGEIDYAQLIKIYGQPVVGETRYSPAECLGCDRRTVTGNPDRLHISTSYVERQNLTMATGGRVRS